MHLWLRRIKSIKLNLHGLGIIPILWKEGTLILINTIGILPFPSYTILMNRMDYLLEILKKENLSIITKEQIDQYRILSPNFFQPNIHLYNEK